MSLIRRMAGAVTLTLASGHSIMSLCPLTWIVRRCLTEGVALIWAGAYIRIRIMARQIIIIIERSTRRIRIRLKTS